MAKDFEQRWAEVALNNSFTTDTADTQPVDASISLTNRLLNLENTKQEKVRKLNETASTLAGSDAIKPITQYDENVKIVGIEDADTALLSDGRQVRISDPSIRYDAAEIKHPGDDSLKEKFLDLFGLGATGKSDFAEQRQREQAARLFNKPAQYVTEQDILDVGNMQQVQAVSDLYRKPGEARWEAPLIKNSTQLDFNTGLDIDVGLQKFGTDEYGRTLGSFINKNTGENITRMQAESQRTNAFAPGTSDYTVNESGEVVKANPGIVDRLENAAKGAGYQLASGIADTLNLVPRAVEYAATDKTWDQSKGLYTEADQEALKKSIGYDDRYTQYVGKEAIEAVKKAYEDGNYKELAGAFWDAATTPEALGETTGFILSMFMPGTLAKKGVSAVSGINTAAKEFMAADKTLSKADAIAKAEEEAGIAYKISKGVAGQTGQIGMAEAQTQDAAKEYEAMYGEPMSSERRTGAFLLNLASVNMDAAIGKAILLGKDPLAKVIKDTLVNSDDVVKRTMVQRIALATGLDTARVAGAILEEAGTEATQAGLENVSKYYNSDKGVGVSDVLGNTAYDIGGAALIGGAGGLQMNRTGEVTRKIFDGSVGKLIPENFIDSIKKDVDTKVQYSFTPDLQYTERPGSKNLSKDEMAVEGMQTVSDIQKYSTKAVAESMYKDRDIKDARGNSITPESGMSAIIDTLRYENLTKNKYVLEDRKNKLDAINAIEDEPTRNIERSKYEESIAGSDLIDKEEYVKDFINTYAAMTKQLRDPKFDVAGDIRSKSIANATKTFIAKAHAEPDLYIRDRLLSEFINGYIAESAKNTIYGKEGVDIKQFGSVGELSKDVMFGDKAEDYIKSLKAVKQVVFGSMPKDENDNPDRLEQEFDEKINAFETMYNEYKTKLNEMKAKNPDADLTLLNAKTKEDVNREIMDGSGFISSIFKPFKKSISGHMNMIRKNVNNIRTDKTGALSQTKSIDQMLTQVSKFNKFADTRTVNNNDAYSDILEARDSGASEQELAQMLFSRENEFTDIRKDVDASNINVDELPNELRKKRVPVYRVGLDSKKMTNELSTGEIMINEAVAFIKNLQEAKSLLVGKIALQQDLLGFVKNNKDKKAIEETIEKLQEKVDEINATITNQENNIATINELRTKLLTPEVVSNLRRLYAQSEFAKESENVEPVGETNETNIDNGEQNGTSTTTEDTKTESGNQESEPTVIEGKGKHETGTTEDGEIGTIEEEISTTIEEPNKIDNTIITGSDDMVQPETVTENVEPEIVSEPEVIDVESLSLDDQISYYRKQIKAISKGEAKIDLLKYDIDSRVKKANAIFDILEKLDNSAIKHSENITKYEKRIFEIETKLSDTESQLSEIEKSELEKESAGKAIALADERRYLATEQINIKKYNGIKKSNAKKVKEIQTKLSKLNEFSNKNLNDGQRLLINNKIRTLEVQQHAIKWKNSIVQKSFEAIKDLENQLDTAKLSGSDSFKLNQLLYDVKVAQRRYANDKFVDKTIRDKAIERWKYTSAELIKKYKGNYELDKTKSFMRFNKISKINEAILKLENYEVHDLITFLKDDTRPVYKEDKKTYAEARLSQDKNKKPRAFDVKDYANLNEKELIKKEKEVRNFFYLILETDVSDVITEYNLLDDMRKGIVKLSKKDKVYSALSKGINPNTEESDARTTLVSNYFALKGKSYENRIDKEYPSGSDKRIAFDTKLSNYLWYIHKSSFVDNDLIIRDSSNKLDAEGNKLGETKSPDIVSYEIKQGKIIALDKDGNTVDTNQSVNLLSLLFGNESKNIKLGKDELKISHTRFPKYFAEVVKLESIKEISNMYKILMTNPNTDTETFDGIWGIDPSSENAEELRTEVYDKYLSQGIIPESVIVRALGQRIYKQLPMTFDRNLLERYTEETIVSQLGIYAIGQFENKTNSVKVSESDEEYGISRWKEVNLETKKLETQMITIGGKTMNGIKLPMNEQAMKLLVDLSETLDYLSVSEDKKIPSFEPITKVPDTIKHKKTKLSDTAIETIKDYQSIAYKFEDNITEMYNLWKDENTRKLAYKYAGIDTPMIEKMTSSEIEKALTKNRNERLELDSLMKFYEEAGTDKEFYLPWDFVTSGRYMVSSNINPQGSKITRFLISTKGTRTDITIRSRDGVASIDGKQLGMVKRSLAQSLDYGLDKDLDLFVIDKMEQDIKISDDLVVTFGTSPKAIIIQNSFNHFKSIILSGSDGKEVSELTEGADIVEKLTLKGISKEPEFEGFHAVQTIRELAKLSIKADEARKVKYADEINFEHKSHFVVEADGITSGMMITLSQIMSDDAIKLFEKGGIYTEEAVEFWNEITVAFEDAGLIDSKHLDDLRQEDGSYKITHGLLNRIGKVIADKNNKAKVDSIFEKDENDTRRTRASFKDFYNTIASSVTKDLPSIRKSLEKDYYKKLNKYNNMEEGIEKENFYKYVNQAYLSVALIDVVGEEISRAMAKDPVMVFIYGSSIGSIKNKILQNLVKSTIEKKIKKLSDEANSSDNGFIEVDETLVNVLSAMDIQLNETQGVYGVATIPSTAKVIDYTRNINGDIDENVVKNLDASEYEGYVNINIRDLHKLKIDGSMLSNIAIPSLNSYGAAFEKAFDDNFAFISEYRDSIKALEVVRFEIFDFKFKEKVTSLIKDRSTSDFAYNPTNAELDAILQELINEGFGHVIKDINGGYHSFEKSQVEDSMNRTSLRTHNKDYLRDDSTTSASIDIRKEVVNTGAAPVTSIHNQDGWQVRYATLKTGIQNVFDAIISGLDNHEDGVYLYNEGFSKANTKHSILQSQLIDMENILDKLGSDGIAKLLSSIDAESSKKILDVFEKMTKPLVNKMAEENAEVKTSYAIADAKKDITKLDALERFAKDTTVSSNEILASLNKKVENVAIAHLYAIDTGKQFSGSLGGFKDMKVDTTRIFNFYNDIIYKAISMLEPELVVEETNVKTGFSYVVENSLLGDSAEVKETRKKLYNEAYTNAINLGLKPEQVDEIMTIVEDLMDCKP